MRASPALVFGLTLFAFAPPARSETPSAWIPGELSPYHTRSAGSVRYRYEGRLTSVGGNEGAGDELVFLVDNRTPVRLLVPLADVRPKLLSIAADGRSFIVHVRYYSVTNQIVVADVIETP